MQAFAHLEHAKDRNRRGSQRRKLRLGATLSQSGDDVVIRDISASGMLIETSAELATFEQLQMEMPEIGQRVAMVIWNSGPFYGCEFQQPIPQFALSAAMLRSPFAGEAPEQPVSVPADEEAPQTDSFVDDRYSFATRLRFVLAVSVLLWGLILWLAGVL